MGKEIKEGKNIHNVGGSYAVATVWTIHSQEVNSLRHHGNKLNHLHHGQGRLPPDRKRFSCLGVSGVHTDKIISVHDRVDKSIEGNGQVDISIIKDIRVQPVKQENGKMMVNVQERELSPLFAQNNENGIPEIPCLGHVKQPQQIGNGCIFRVEFVAWHQRISVSVGQQSTFNCHVSAQHNLRNIVKKFDRIGVDGRNSSLHNGRSDKNKAEVCKSDTDGRGEIRQGPSLFSNKKMRQNNIKRGSNKDE